ncbi:hypothetical protein [Candidatus Phytoplasma sp. AldY-WA1]|uniref:hypothetical protein n=1 Tax=Candidatus Phytoplasma sp. AldY-WA1 TaxID=2852100 RepID=UPI00254EAF3E|nr:hypothetical protein [Candidatus Phytoplasma sp. AldY-WA1]
MNQNYKNLPQYNFKCNKYSEYNEIVFSKSNISSKFYAVVFDKLSYEPFDIFYYDYDNLTFYFELTQPVLEKFLTDKRYKIQKISGNWYQFIHPELIEKAKSTISTQQPSTTIKSNTSSNKQIIELKTELEKIKPEVLLAVRIYEHTGKSKNNKKINLKLNGKNGPDIYTPSELKNSVVELLKSFQPSNQEQPTLPQNDNNNQKNEPEPSKIETIATYNIFKKNYKNLEKNRIKEILKTIPINKLQDLKLYKIDPDKKDKFDKPIRTNFKNYKKSILYYRETDLSIIKQFLKQTKQGFDVKSCQEDRKKIVYNGKIICLSNKNKIIKNNVEFYINFDGKKYYYLVSFDGRQRGLINSELTNCNV